MARMNADKDNIMFGDAAMCAKSGTRACANFHRLPQWQMANGEFEEEEDEEAEEERWEDSGLSCVAIRVFPEGLAAQIRVFAGVQEQEQ